MEIVIDGIEFILTMISITASIIFAIIQSFVKLRALFRETIREIVKNEVEELKDEIKELKRSNEEMKKEIEDVKRKIEKNKYNDSE